MEDGGSHYTRFVFTDTQSTSFTAEGGELKYDTARAIMRHREWPGRRGKKCGRLLPLDFFTSGSGSASLIN